MPARYTRPDAEEWLYRHGLSSRFYTFASDRSWTFSACHLWLKSSKHRFHDSNTTHSDCFSAQSNAR